ncbi:hypothetical protein [Bradyrhizobium sp. STM 3557]|uniref:hypothetical protein n=1 Tax=Bradyrhizobium sp. STM 3557 TaxID=578920 RepID=UPI00388DB1A7
MPLLTSITSWRRTLAAPVQRSSVGRRSEPDDLLTCMLAFSAVGLFASCLALAMEHEIPHIAVLELVLICAAPPLAAIAGLSMIRRR